MAKYVAHPVGTGFGAQSNLNQNFEDIEDNFQRVLYRDGSSPNQMEADLDMNDHDIYNVNNIDTLSLSINGQQVVANETFVTPLPDPAGQDGKFIRSNGVSASWQYVADTDITLTGALIIPVATVAAMKALTGLSDGARISTTEYFSGTGVGGGDYIYDSSIGSFDEFEFVEATNIPGGFRLLTKSPTLLQAGCAADGTTDSTTRLQAALDSSFDSLDTTGADFVVSSVTSTTKKKIYGTGTIRRTSTAASDLFDVSASGCEFYDFNIIGPNENTKPSTQASGQRAVYAHGTNSASPLADLVVRNVKINGFQGTGIDARYVTDVCIDDNKIEYCGYAGIIVLSAVRGGIRNNIVNQIDATTVTNAYGITATRDPTLNEATSARSNSLEISGNVVANVTQWIGLDVHAGQNIDVHDNLTIDCLYGGNIQYDSSSATFKLSPNNIAWHDNIHYTTLVTTDIGINAVGLSSDSADNIHVYDNIIIGHGAASGGSSGAINAQYLGTSTIKRNKIYSFTNAAGTFANLVDTDIAENWAHDRKSAGGYYWYIDASTMTNCTFKRNQARYTSFSPNYGIFVASAVSGRGIVLHQNRIELSSTNYLYNGTATNQWAELAWDLESVDAYSASAAVTSGNTSETRNVTLPKAVYGSQATGTLMTMADRALYSLATAKIFVRATGMPSATSVQITIFTADGTTFGAAYGIDAVISTKGIVFAE